MSVSHSLQIDEDSLGLNRDQKDEKVKSETEEGDSVNLKEVWGSLQHRKGTRSYDWENLKSSLAERNVQGSLISVEDSDFVFNQTSQRTENHIS